MTRSTRQTTWCVGTHEQRLCVMSNHASALPQRSGFTLVELLVVITIIGVLAALITPAVFQARRSGQISAIKAEIDLLHMAMMHYKNEYGSFPPAVSPGGSSGVAASHIQRLFPRSSPSPSAVTDDAALVGWLGGYSKNPTNPLALPRVKLFEFDQNRVTSTNQFHPREKLGSPYRYVNSAQYFLTRTPTSYTLRPFVQLRVTEDLNGNGVLDGTEDVNSNSRLDCEAFNPDTFQILCAGLDETWNTDDDLSNFWKGTRGDQ
ncbi:prepilin-type N-terminal cleavage/methylation domain-containing protein [Pirellulales bacterium]|nr:prepilin-type N-terminal cleavage/methylation domain-containing protein [Pirellulales bacterium]